MKISRNDPCPCGSGRKYKQCCLDKQTSAPSSGELAWRRIRRDMEGLPGRMLRFADQAYGPEGLDEAWREFMLWDDDEAAFDDDSPHVGIFLAWMLHHWSPNPDETDVADASLHEVVPTQTFLQRKKHQLSPVIREYLQSCMDRPFSFYEVEHVEAGRSMSLRDLLTDERHEAYERGASQSLAVHDVVYAQLASADGIVLIEAICPIALSPSDKVPIITLRKRIHQNEASHAATHDDVEKLQMWDLELRNLYLSLSERYLYPSLPQLVTTDGDAFEFHSLVYDIDSAQTAFDALKHLNPMISDSAAAGADIQRDADGLIRHAQIDWVRMDQGDNAGSGTLLGTLTIDGTRLIAEVKSRERADRLKGIVDEALAGNAIFRADKIQTIEQAMAESTPSPSPLPQDSLQAQAIIVDYLRNHYAQWPDMPLPALGNRTPRDTAQTPLGREQVEALLREAEQHNPDLPAAVRKTIFDAVRLQLGLHA